MISINVIILSKYMIGEVYFENRSHPENIIFIRRICHSDSKIRALGIGPSAYTCTVMYGKIRLED